MGTHYSHLSSNDRHVIEVFLRVGVRAAAVAAFLGRPRSTVCREVQRSRSFKGSPRYIAHFGQLYSERARRQAGLARRKLPPDLNSPAWSHVRQGLAAGLSPKAIDGRLVETTADGQQRLIRTLKAPLAVQPGLRLSRRSRG